MKKFLAALAAVARAIGIKVTAPSQVPGQPDVVIFQHKEGPGGL